MVTVVIPVGPGHVALLPHALRSCQQPGVERVIVVNDSGQALSVPSVDGGRRGVAHARNVGASFVQTPYIMFLDADDILTTNSAAVLLKGMQESPGAAYVYGDWWEQNANGTMLYKHASPQSRLMAGGIHPITCLLPTKIAQAVPFESDVPGWEDWVYWLEVAAHGHCGQPIPAPVLIYRQHTGLRREQSYLKGDDLIKSIRARFAPRLAEVSFMARGCRGCGGSHHMTINQTPQSQLAAGPVPTGYITIEYIGDAAGAHPRRLPNGRNIRFGALNTNERIQALPAEDAELAIQTWPRLFRKIEQPDAGAALAAIEQATADNAPALPESFFALSPEERMAELKRQREEAAASSPASVPTGAPVLLGDDGPELITPDGAITPVSTELPKSASVTKVHDDDSEDMIPEKRRPGRPRKNQEPAGEDVES